MTTTETQTPEQMEPIPAFDSPAAEPGCWSWLLTWETAAWLVLGLVALFTRLWNLSARVMSHDESLHVYYSWLLSKGSGYSHNPMMHGPALFEFTAIFDRLFGTN